MKSEVRVMMVAGAVLVASAGVFADVPQASCTIRSKADLRVWETVLVPSSPLTWPWENGADSATVSLTDRATGKGVSVTVEKTGGELYGTYMPTLPAGGSEVLYSAELVLHSGDAEVSRYSAELAYVNGVAGIPFTVRDAESDDWTRLGRPELATYDAAWKEDTAGAAVSTLSVGGGAASELAGASGYFVLKSPALGDVRFDLGFDDDPCAWTAFLRCGVPGMMMIIR